MGFSNRLKRARQLRGRSQKEMAEELGISKTDYTDLEKGVFASSPHTPRLAELLRVDPDWLATGEAPDRNNVIVFSGITSFDTDADTVLNAAVGELSDVIIAGYTKDGSEYFASSCADGPQVLWLLKRFEQRLLKIGEDDESR